MHVTWTSVGYHRELSLTASVLPGYFIGSGFLADRVSSTDPVLNLFLSTSTRDAKQYPTTNRIHCPNLKQYVHIGFHQFAHQKFYLYFILLCASAYIHTELHWPCSFYFTMVGLAGYISKPLDLGRMGHIGPVNII